MSYMKKKKLSNVIFFYLTSTSRLDQDFNAIDAASIAALASLRSHFDTSPNICPLPGSKNKISLRQR